MNFERILNSMFAKLNTSSIDELLQMYIRELMDNPPTIPRCTKSNERSVEYKKKGDENMKRYSYHDALSAYTCAIRFAHPYSKMIGMCFAERSLALLKLGEYEDSLSDTERALQLPLSEELKLEVTKRKEQLMRNVKRKTKEKSSEVDPTLTLSHGENKEISGASSAIGISYNDQFGRHIIATKPIKAGDVLLIQRPYTHMVTFPVSDYWPDYSTCICNNCLDYTKAPIPCDWCATALYCSTECRSEALQSHREIECRLSFVDGKEQKPNQYIKILKIITNNGDSFNEVKGYLEDILNCKDVRKAGFVDGRLVGTDVRAFLSLAHQDRKHPNYLMHARYAAFLAFSLRNRTNFLRGSNDVLGLAKFMFHLCNILNTNFEIVRQKVSNKFGIYPIFSLLNHSCVSNTISYSLNDNCKVLRASRDIMPGKQIFFNYLRFWISGLKASDRKEILREGKNYVCRCIACKCNYSFKSELNKLEIPEQLRFTLVRQPASIEGLWELLNLLHRKISGPCSEIEVIKRALENVYEDKESDFLPMIYSAFGIF